MHEGTVRMRWQTAGVKTSVMVTVQRVDERRGGAIESSVRNRAAHVLVVVTRERMPAECCVRI